MGHLHHLQKQYGEAIKFYQQALDKDPASTDAMQGIMNAYLAQKQPDQAIAAARTQIAKSPNTGGFYDLLGTALFQRKDLSWRRCRAAQGHSSSIRIIPTRF